MSESMREEFEEWRIDKFCGGGDRLKKCSNAPDVYYYTAEQEAWITWQASRAALCVEFPLPVKRAHHEYDLGYNEALDHCEEAIHAAGVKTN